METPHVGGRMEPRAVEGAGSGDAWVLQKEQIMSINKLFDRIDQVRESAQWQAAFGQPQVVEGKTIIPVAQVSYGFGLGFGSEAGPSEEQSEPPAGGGGGGSSAKPLGVIVVTPEGVRFEPVLDVGKMAMAGLGVVVFSALQFSKTFRAISGRK
jgi:uncharacterized spore protein YtfJ